MADNKQKIYVKGSAKEVGNYGVIAASIKLEQLQEFADHKGYVKISIYKKREVDQYGNTHYITIDQGKN
ncbi:MAG TPA: hypothetical protein VD908_07775 [Cytophagales bacterium]|nr:hypothetical protein [Cytophagales bacterium]